MKIAKTVLLFVGAGFIAFGLTGLLMPEMLVGAVGIDLTAEQSRTEIRAMYGGMQVGIGIFLLFSALNPLWLRPGLALVILSCTGLASARLFGIQIEGAAFPWMLPIAILELGITALCLWAWVAVRNEQQGVA